jgi:hypothetical protein
MLLSCTDTNTVSKWTKTRFHTTHVAYEFHQVRPNLLMSLWYVQCKPYTYLTSKLALSLNGPNRAPPVPRHLGVPSSASKTIYEPMVCLTQTELPLEPRHLGVPSSASKTTSIPMDVRCKPCSYLALTLTLSPNGLKRDSTRPTSLTSSIRCIQINL